MLICLFNIGFFIYTVTTKHYPTPRTIKNPPTFLSYKMEQQIRFNLSPSSLNTYYESPLLFYLKYIAKVPDDTKVPVCYGLSGSIVHDCLEKYAKCETDRDQTYLSLATKWQNQNLHIHQDVKGETLDQTQYLIALLNGMQIIDNHQDHICEEMISFPLIDNEQYRIGIKGIVDLQTTQKDDNQNIVADYKTSNRIDEGENFRRQALFYNLLIYKKKNIIPNKSTFFYLKLNKRKDYTFTVDQMLELEQEIKKVAETIISYGNDIGRYPIGDIDSIFNSKKQACLNEIERRKKLF